MKVHAFILHFRLSFCLRLRRLCLLMLKVDVLDISHWVGLPLMVHFLLCAVNDLNLIDLVLTGLDLSDPDYGISLGKHLRVYFEISC